MDYIFGYGSIINDDSRCGTLYESTSQSHTRNLSRNQLSAISPFPGGSSDEAVAVSVSSHYAKRCWNFRCTTGFTALGFVLQQSSINDLDSTVSSTVEDINGVIFPVNTAQQLQSFDLREVGYNRVCIPLKFLTVETSLGCDAAQTRARSLQERIHQIQETSSSQQALDLTDHDHGLDHFQGIGRMFSDEEDFYHDDTSTTIDSSPTLPHSTTELTTTTPLSDQIRVWVYVPDPTYAARPNEDHPILQTYLDLCIRGCLQWGGPALVKKFILSTMDWSECFLNDAPLSRRPWIYRKDYSLIDQCLAESAHIVKFDSRKHPEEYASLHQTAFKPGQWGLPNRNPLFTGREDYLRILHTKLTLYDNTSAAVLNSSISTSASSSTLQQSSPHFIINEVQLIGHGGVGKSQLTIEYAHRYLKSYYNFIAFIRAESSATISSDLRKLAMDLNIMSQHKKKVHPTNLDTASPLKLTPSRLLVSLPDDSSGGIQAATDPFESPAVSLGAELATLDDETIAEEIRKRLTRCRFKWLLIFDNVDDPSVLSLCVPRGVEGVGCGHIIVTSRISHPDWSTRGTILNLHCFDKKESITYLQTALSASFVEEDRPNHREENRPLFGSEGSASSRDRILDKLANSLGHLPLALSTASIYMSRCDVRPAEYLRRLDSNNMSSLENNNQLTSGAGSGVASSQDALMSCFGLTLDRIECENPSAVSVLPCLGYLAPDISKEIVHYLLCCGHFKMIGPQETPPVSLCQSSLGNCLPAKPHPSVEVSLWTLSSATALLIGTLFFLHFLLPFSFPVSIRNLEILLVGLIGGMVICFLTLLFVLSSVLLESPLSQWPQLAFQISIIPSRCHDPASPLSTIHTQTETNSFPKRPVVTLTSNDEAVMAQTDQLWHSLRQFSLISLVRESGVDTSEDNTSLTQNLVGSNRVGTIHRLQQSVLRVRVSRRPQMKLLCLERCVWLLATLWKFTPHDISTWKASGDLIEHLQILTRHLADLYQQHSSTEPTLSSASLLTLSKLLTDASQYTAIILSKHDDSEQLLHLSLTVISFLKETLNTATSSSPKTSPHQLTHETLFTHAYTLHMLGKVCRYNGKLVESEKYLKKSLEMNKALLSLGKRSTELTQSQRDELRGVLLDLSLVDVIRETRDSDFTEILCGLDKLLHLSARERESRVQREQQTGSLCQIQSRLSDTLHELGVLFLRTHHLPLSKSYLLSSLKIQSNPSLHLSPSDLFSLCMNKASSLYQLGVIHTIEQRYPLAQVFLDYSLRLMQDMQHLPPPLSANNGHSISGSTGNDTIRSSSNNYPLGVSVMSKAAVFQQLGKIEYRKGVLPKAKEYMFLALNIYEEIYGDGDTSNYPTKSNINIACIHHQLGTIYTALHDYASACEHLVKSLQIREMMLLEYKSGHVLDYVISLQAIGKAEVEHRGADVALTYLLRAKQLIEDELREATIPSEGRAGHGGGRGGGETSVMTYRCSSSTTAFVGMIDIGEEVESEDIPPLPHPHPSPYPLSTTAPVSAPPLASPSSISSSYCEMLTRQLESCLHSLKRITKLKKDYPQSQQYAKELKALKKKELDVFASEAVKMTTYPTQQLVQTIVLPPNTTLKVDETFRSDRGEFEWDTSLAQSLERIVMVRSEVRAMCLQTLKVLKQLPLDASRGVIEATICQCLSSKDELLHDEHEGEERGEETGETWIQRVGEAFLTEVRGILSGSGTWSCVTEVRENLSSLLGLCDTLRTQLKEHGLILEDKR
jgi:tetratricopeptide (TPR) repeat protein